MSREASVLDFLQGPVRIAGSAFTAVGRDWLDGCYKDKSVEIFPGVYQHTPKYHSFKRSLYSRLKDIPQVFSAQDGWWFSTPNQVLVDWGSLSSPILCPMEDNTQLRRDFGLRDPSPQEEEIARSFFAAIIRSGYPSSIHLKRVSTVGFPLMQRGVRLRLAIIKRVTDDLSGFLNATAEHDWAWRMRFTGSYPAFTNGIRIQADAVTVDENGVPTTKQRYSYSEAAIEKGAFTDSDRIPIDKTCRDSLGNLADGIVSARVRSMYAEDYDDNCLLQMLNNYLYNGLKETCVGVHYEGEIKLSNEIKKFLNFKRGDIFTLDKSNFGETFSPRILEIFLEELGQKWPVLAEFVRTTIDAVTFIRSYRKNTPGVILTRRTISKDRRLSLKGSFRSGHGLVSFLGKALGALDAILIARQALGSTFSLERFLKNSDPRYRYYGSGDDTMFVCKEDGVGRVLRQAVDRKASLHKDELEDGPRFLGNFYSDYGDVQVDLAKFLETMTGVERSYKLKKFPKLGIFAKYEKYKTNPLFRDVSQIVEEEYLKWYDFSLRKYINGQSLVGAGNVIFLNDPDKVMYLPGLEVDANLLASEYETVSAEAIADYIARFI